jgi:hypothetical protein
VRVEAISAAARDVTERVSVRDDVLETVATRERRKSRGARDREAERRRCLLLRLARAG